MARVETVQPTAELGRRLEAKREELQLGMDEMAEHLGVRKPAYHNWLRGGRPTSKENIKRVMEVLDIDLIEFWELLPEVVRSLNLTRAPLSGRQTVDYRRPPGWDGRPNDKPPSLHEAA